MRLYSSKDRPFHLGPWPLERLPRAALALPASIPSQPRAAVPHAKASLAPCFPEYFSVFRAALDGKVAPAQAPVPAEGGERSANLKSHAYFLDAALVGVCDLDAHDWSAAPLAGHRHAAVFLVEFGREAAPGEPGAGWIGGSNEERTDLRATELAAVLSGMLRAMGFAARGHAAGASAVQLERLALKAGLVRIIDGELRAPFLGRGFRVGAVTTEYALAPDLPLAQQGPLVPDDADMYFGVGGTLPGWTYEREAERPLHMGRYPMETIKRAAEPTTLVLREEIQRVPKRGDFFKRAEAGDLGEKARRERKRFPFKHPYALGMQPLIQGMVPLQGGREKFPDPGLAADPAHNAMAIKALGYYLGADFVGICRAEPWMYYSHDEVEGKPIEAYHEYAVVMLIDQGYETMEGASGDDWISASQSMRAYMRGAEIAGLMAAHCRRLGYSSRAHSNAHSEVIHNPAILMAGLGEVSRIGDTILNPFIGPRSKSVVFTTDLPMAIDQPIDFGLQDFCGQCNKCARECPCNAITFGPKVMFNGYEIWKADVDKCTKYRVTQSRGSACGRCMKMCPWNREDTLEAHELALLSIQMPTARPWIIRQDDLTGAGSRNLAKRWWFDLEVIDGVAVVPPAGTNEHGLNLGRDARLAPTQKLAFFPPALQPRGGTTLAEVVPVDRAAGLKAYQEAETPEAARARLAEAVRGN